MESSASAVAWRRESRWRPEAGEVLERVGRLYAIEADAKRASPEERLATLGTVRNPGAVTLARDLTSSESREKSAS